MFSPTDGSQSQEDTPSKGHACNGKSGQSAGMSMTPSPAGSSVNIGMTFYNNFGGDSIGMTPMAIDPFSSSDLGQRPKQPKKHELGCEIKIVARGRKDSKADALRKKLADANGQITSTNEIVIAMAQTAQGVYDNATSIIKEARAHSKRQHQQAKQFIKRASTAEARQSKMAMTVSKLSKEMETLKQSLKAEKETVKIKTAMIASNKETLSTLNSTIKTLNGTIKDQEKKINNARDGR